MSTNQRRSGHASAAAERHFTGVGTATLLPALAVAVTVIAFGAPSAAQEPGTTPRHHPVFLDEDNITFDGTAGDLFGWAAGITAGGTIHDNAILAGQSVAVNGAAIGGDLFVGGQSITVDSEIQGDLYAVGGMVRLAPEAVVHGDMVIWAGGVVVDGNVEGRLQGEASHAVLNGTLGEVIDLDVDLLRVGEAAAVTGDLHYQARREAEIPATARVGGNVQFTQAVAAEGRLLNALLLKLWLFLGALIVGLVLLRLGGETSRRPARILVEHPRRALLTGFGVFVVLPALSLLAVVLVVPLLLGAFGLVVYFLALYAAGLIVASALGDLLLRRLFRRRAPSPYAAFALGLIVLHLVLAIPYAGFLVRLAAVAAGLGALFLAARNRGDSPEATPA